MFDTIEDLDPAAVLGRAADRRRCADTAEAELLALAAHWADLHPVLDSAGAGDGVGGGDGVAVAGMQRLMPLAGPGTPPVAEFAPAELAATLGLSSYAGQQLVGDALELRHRLPRLWARIMAGDLQAWRGRKIAERTRCLSLEAAAWVDAQAAPFAHKIGPARVAALVEAALIRFDPETAAANARRAAQTRGVWVSDEMTDGTRSIRIEADALDAAAFDDTIGQIAAALAGLGDPDTTDLRRAKAVGVIADPQGTLNLLTDDPTDDHPAEGTDDSGNDGGDGDSGAAAGDPGAAAAKPRRGRRSTGRPRVVLYLHLSHEALGGHGMGRGVGQGVGRVEGLGPVPVELIRDWVGRSEVVIKPVLDLADRIAVDAYEVPDRITETVLLRNPCCPFPWCNNATRRKDLDHIEPYRPPETGGPPGQTTPTNLAPLCRRHHRLKTHGGWTYTMPEPGIYLWRSPAGRRYLVDHTGTTQLQHTA